jgi:uncharacterized membrane protein YvbJ
MKCHNCGAEIPDNSDFCSECGEQINIGTSDQTVLSNNDAIISKKNDTDNKQTDSISNNSTHNVLPIISGIVGAILICISIYFFSCGFNKKDNYSSSLTNAYVGGDAYNYIINGTYFSGYMTLGSGLLVSGIALCCTGLIIETRRYK